ncbi:hypothetical protein Lal_00041451 [Lupinus albus]|nr:hypothetical protein Lal_00041451 [Lupinus albus]
MNLSIAAIAPPYNFLITDENREIKRKEICTQELMAKMWSKFFKLTLEVNISPPLKKWEMKKEPEDKIVEGEGGVDFEALGVKDLVITHMRTMRYYDK